MNYEIEGNLVLKYDEQQVSASFKKREFVIEVENERNPDWNDFVKFQSTQDKTTIIDAANIGDKVKVLFNIRGRKWEKDGKTNYFSSLEAWNIEVLGKASNTPPQAENYPKPAHVPADDSSEDDLPF